MAEVIYSVIIRHIVKWTTVKRVILAGFGELEKTPPLFDSLLSGCRSSCQELICEPRQNQRKMEAQTTHIPLFILKMSFVPSILLRTSC